MTDGTNATAAAPTTLQLVQAFADALAPLAGPYGLAADGVMHAGLVFLASLQAQKAAGATVYTMADLEGAAAKATADLAALQASVNALPG